jgi:hypothetical protein
MSNNLQQFLEWEKRIPDALFLRQPLNGKWKHYTYSQRVMKSEELPQV